MSAPATNLLANIHVKPGFRLELVAESPQVSGPVAMAFDENGRLFVVERPEDPEQHGTNAPVGRIRLFEDTEGTGEFHASGIYADDLPWASALACYGGGIFVAAGHDLIFLKDSKTNGVADVRRVVFSGFGGTNALQAQALPNNFNWGLDNHIHGANTGLAGNGAAPGAPGSAPVLLTGGDFAFDPRLLTVSLESGPPQSGLTFDDAGRKFFCDPAHPLRTLMFEQRYLARNPFFPAPQEVVEVASPATVIFRSVPKAAAQPASGSSGTTNEAAPKVVRVTNVLVPAWLTNAQGCVIYRGHAFPSKYLGNAFIADPVAHIIHRAVLSEGGLDLAAFRAPDEKSTEFVVSSDPGFCPVQIVNGPDGALYVVDRRDGYVGGRIYRIVPTGFKPPKPPQMGKATTYDLVALLSHPNGWQRDTAARLLYERREREAVPLLGSMLYGSTAPLGRLHALHALDGMAALNEACVLRALKDPDERVREHGVLLSERLVAGGVIAGPLWDQLYLMATDPSIRVRLQLALTLGEIRRPERARVFTGILWRDAASYWMRPAILSSLAEGAGDLFVNLAGDPRARGDRAGQEWLRRLATLIGVRAEPTEVEQALVFLEQASIDPVQTFDLLCVLGDALHRARSSLALMDPKARLQPFYSQALDPSQDYSVPEPLRIGEMLLLGVGPFTFADTGDLLLLQLGSGQPGPIQSAAITALGRFPDPRVAPALIQRWGILSPRLRHDALTALLARSDRCGSVLAAVESGGIARAELSLVQVDYLRTQRDPAISQRALQLLGPVTRQRPDAVKRFRPALSLRGSATGGREIYLARCAVCHPLERAAQGLGPDLTTAKLYGKEKTLTAILEPNLNVRRDYLTYVAETAEGEDLIGVLRNDNGAAITLRQLNGAEVVLPRSNLKNLQAQPWSLMPEGIEEGLTLQNMADLLGYIAQLTTIP